MENSETQKRVINLGKILVEELGKDTDTLTRWMAHYISEQINVAETATGKNKKDAEKRCFDTILKLWSNRTSLPDGKRPFENFEPIFRTLEALDPKNETTFYWGRFFNKLLKSNDTLNNTDQGVETWIDIACDIDIAARILLEFAFKQTASFALDKKAANWLESAPEFYDDVSVIINLTSASQGSEDDYKTITKKMRGELKDELNFKIEKIATLIKIGNRVRRAYNDELKKLS